MNPNSRSYSRLTPAYAGGHLPDSRGGSQYLEVFPSIADLPPDAAKATKRDFKKLFSRLKRILRHVSYALVIIFALIGVAFSGVFVAMQYHLLDVKGSSVSRDKFFAQLPKAQVLAASVPKHATATSCVEQGANGQAVPVCAWNSSEEYATIRDGLVKDKDVINQVAEETGVPARMIASMVVPEQLRWFTDDRETFKKTFEPLKVLGVAANMTYGIGGFHPDTAARVEQYTMDNNSPFYAGDGMAALVAYPAGTNHDSAMLARLSDYKDHHYSYLYVALFVKEITNQWAKEGYDVSSRPDVIATLYNIGFDRSAPKANPQIGGADITVNNTKYTYGELGTDFYYSDELTSIFSR